MGQYNLLDDVKSESHVTLWLYAIDFIVLVGYIYFSFLLKTLVAKPFQTLFMIYSVFCAVLLTFPSPFNRKRRMYQSILIYLKRDKTIYHPVYKEEKR